MTLADLEAGRKATPCKVGKILAELSEKERKTVDTALAGSMKTYPHTKIAAALSVRVEYVSAHVVRIHRTEKCSCQR